MMIYLPRQNQQKCKLKPRKMNSSGNDKEEDSQDVSVAKR